MFSLVPGIDFTKATGRRTLGTHYLGRLKTKSAKTKKTNKRKSEKEIGGVVHGSKERIVGGARSCTHPSTVGLRLDLPQTK